VIDIPVSRGRHVEFPVLRLVWNGKKEFEAGFFPKFIPAHWLKGDLGKKDVLAIPRERIFYGKSIVLSRSLSGNLDIRRTQVGKRDQ
jgi:hypothetical protein